MAGYVIHLAVGEEYLRNFPNEIINYEKFIEGIIYPDTVSEKSLTHYGPKSSQVHLNEFFSDRDLDNDFNKGYFIHLVTDYLFYNRFLTVFSKKYIYNDYDILNKSLEDKFKVKIPDKIKNYVFFNIGETKILNLDEVINFIKETATYDINFIKNEVLNGNKDWLTIRPLIKI